VQEKYNRGVRSKRIERVAPALETILRHGLTETDWAALA
jgi:hypothetical protein